MGAFLIPDNTISMGGVLVHYYPLTAHNPNKIAMPSAMQGKILGVTIHNTGVINAASGTYEYDTTYDTFWLPSKEEEYTTANEPNHREGYAWQYWKNVLTGPALEINESLPQQNYASAEVTHAIKAHRRFALNNQSTAVVVRLRSCYRGTSYHVWHISTAGFVSYNPAISSYRCAPACEIC